MRSQNKFLSLAVSVLLAGSLSSAAFADKTTKEEVKQPVTKEATTTADATATTPTTTATTPTTANTATTDTKVAIMVDCMEKNHKCGKKCDGKKGHKEMTEEACNAEGGTVHNHKGHKAHHKG
jgi:flagellar basal body-associated protein FliL